MVSRSMRVGRSLAMARLLWLQPAFIWEPAGVGGSATDGRLFPALETDGHLERPVGDRGGRERRALRCGLNLDPLRLEEDLCLRRLDGEIDVLGERAGRLGELERAQGGHHHADDMAAP